MRKARTLVGVVHSISERDDEFLLGERHVPLRGTNYVTDRRDELTFRISAGSFYQVHGEAGELLYKPALRMCGDMRGKNVVDGYGGVGTFGLRLAKAGAATVTIVENTTPRPTISPRSPCCASRSRLPSSRMAPTSWSSTRRGPACSPKVSNARSLPSPSASCTSRAPQSRWHRT